MALLVDAGHDSHSNPLIGKGEEALILEPLLMIEQECRRVDQRPG
jgi:hypothetical protein